MNHSTISSCMEITSEPLFHCPSLKFLNCNIETSPGRTHQCQRSKEPWWLSFPHPAFHGWGLLALKVGDLSKVLWRWRQDWLRASDPDSQVFCQYTEPTRSGLWATVTSWYWPLHDEDMIRNGKECKHRSPTALTEQFCGNQTKVK